MIKLKLNCFRPYPKWPVKLPPLPQIVGDIFVIIITGHMPSRLLVVVHDPHLCVAGFTQPLHYREEVALRCNVKARVSPRVAHGNVDHDSRSVAADRLVMLLTTARPRKYAAASCACRGRPIIGSTAGSSDVV